MVNQKIIKENLKRVEQGKALTLPLADLGPSFKLQYLKITKQRISLQCSGKPLKKGNQTTKICPYCNHNFITQYPTQITCSIICRNKIEKEIYKWLKK